MRQSETTVNVSMFCNERYGNKNKYIHCSQFANDKNILL